MDSKSNQKSKKKAGQPPKFSTAEELQGKIDEYFLDCDEREAVYTIEGLSYWLDIDRQTLVNYGKKEEFFGTVKKAKAKVLSQLHELAAKGKYNPAIAIFSLKNNYGYVDRTEVKNEHSGEIRRGMDSFYNKSKPEE